MDRQGVSWESGFESCTIAANNGRDGQEKQAKSGPRDDPKTT